MNKKFYHKSLDLASNKKLVYTAMSKHIFYYRMFVSKFVLQQGNVPLNPFMIFEYFLLDTIDRDLVREANNNLVKRSDELWVFGPISDGVLVEIKIAQSLTKKVRFFCIDSATGITECDLAHVQMEDNVVNFRSEFENHNSQ